MTLMQATPITWRLMLAAGWSGKRDLSVICGGEALPADLARALAPIVHALWNFYGPTETTIWSTGYRVSKPVGPILIGRPLANTRCYVLDAELRPLPIGAAGELFIGGAGLARGYWNRPELDAEKFVGDPYTHGPARMYRTGDIARYHDDGNLECLGRTDHQVKIRGFRIELGEIEARLVKLPYIAQAVVVAREDTPGDKKLVAYVVANGGLPSPSELRAALKETLPDYMIPAAYVALREFPLTANGKVDRRALPAPDDAAAVTERIIVRPRTHVEKQLSEIWEEIFATPRVGVHDDFFDLGGHSLLALRLMGRVGQVFGKQLPLNTLFESPTIEQLARHIESGTPTVGQHTLRFDSGDRLDPPVFWIPGGAALGLFSLRHVVTRLGPNQPVYGLGSNYPTSLDDVERVEQRAANSLRLVRQVQPHGPYCFAGFCAGGRWRRMARRLRRRRSHCLHSSDQFLVSEISVGPSRTSAREGPAPVSSDQRGSRERRNADGIHPPESSLSAEARMLIAVAGECQDGDCRGGLPAKRIRAERGAIEPCHRGLRGVRACSVPRALYRCSSPTILTLAALAAT